jgi:hypothetical protein
LTAGFIDTARHKQPHQNQILFAQSDPDAGAGTTRVLIFPSTFVVSVGQPHAVADHLEI